MRFCHFKYENKNMQVEHFYGIDIIVKQYRIKCARTFEVGLFSLLRLGLFIETTVANEKVRRTP